MLERLKCGGTYHTLFFRHNIETMSDAGSLDSKISGAHSGGLTNRSRSSAQKEKERASLNHLVNETVRLAFKEKENSREAQTQRLEEKRMKERVQDLATKLSSVAAAQLELKNDTSLEKKIHGLELKLGRANALIVDLQHENKTMQEKFTAQINQLERKIDHGLNSERTKRLHLFNRSTKKFDEDVEKLRMSLEESLTFIDERSQKEWTAQSKCLEVLREKIDIALIRRLGYLPNTSCGIAAAQFASGEPEYVYVKGRDVAVEEVQSSPIVDGRNKEEEVEKEADAALQSKISTFFAEGPPRVKKWDMGLDVDIEYGGPKVYSSPRVTKPPLPPFERAPTGAGAGAGTGDTLSGALYNQGLDAHHILHSMESRIDDVSKHIESLNKAQQLKGVTQAMLAERAERMRRLYPGGKAAQESSDEYPGSSEKEYGSSDIGAASGEEEQGNFSAGGGKSGAKKGRVMKKMKKKKVDTKRSPSGK